MTYRIAPLPGTFMITSILGFLVVASYTMSGRINATWGFSFGLVFLLMFIASVISITPPPLPANHAKMIAAEPVAVVKKSAAKKKKREGKK